MGEMQHLHPAQGQGLETLASGITIRHDYGVEAPPQFPLFLGPQSYLQCWFGPSLTP